MSWTDSLMEELKVGMKAKELVLGSMSKESYDKFNDNKLDCVASDSLVWGKKALIKH